MAVSIERPSRAFAPLAVFVCALAASAALAQQRRERTPTPRATQRRAETRPQHRPSADAGRSAAEQGDADESFELNIAERRITEQNFFASTGAAAARGLNLRVGAAVGTERIDVTLRNVRGSGRFRGSLAAAGRVLNSRVVSQAAGTQRQP